MHPEFACSSVCAGLRHAFSKTMSIHNSRCACGINLGPQLHPLRQFWKDTYTQEAKEDRANLLATMRAWSAAVRPRYTSKYKPTGLCWLPTSILPKHVADGVPLQKTEYERMVDQVGRRCAHAAFKHCCIEQKPKGVGV